MATVLLVEDEPAVRLGVRLALERAGHRVLEAGSAGEAWPLLKEAELVVLDWMLPDEPGVRLLERMRQGVHAELPVLLLTARAEVRDRVEGLSRGADDYLVKPFATEELLARLEALLRRAGKRKVLKRGPLLLDLERMEASLEGQPLPLTRREFELLAFLAQRPGRVYTREELLEAVWGPDYLGTPRTVDQHILQLREKLREDPKAPRFLETVRGLGYRFRGEG
ncbi:Two component transcriptional regulator PhoB [Thermus sp. CCB_US3_UF1]|uniref:response regulator transcription factor n=1 Tax=unclassified Thermus TaxID=2619321 RepID=UPI00023894D3|nr:MULTISPECIES: response regulator transcription factor [unclassified Thermus]AEV16883.1 Two component transcriptional regulator PhoB [Thermus sp. CCB_US3_UF1]MCS6867142.1 response regulator transcription factor [Thermus sp.]MCX7850093.1 response regulator transcription factor [Thermus sp.]MDW8017049.1 response regulator transcription factor [Thermus sp.]MDW8356319.1 response regulator transcription factor [Thermus sp.]